MASGIYGIFARSILDNTTNGRIDFDTDTIKIALLTSSYTPNFATHDFFDDVSAAEVSGTGYTAGGATLASAAVTLDTSGTPFALFDAADASWTTSTITARYAVIYKSTGTASTSPLALLYDFGSNQSTSGTTFLIQFSASGILKVAT